MRRARLWILGGCLALGAATVAAQDGAASVEAGRRAFEAGQYAAAKAQLGAVARADPKNGAAAFYLGRVALMETNYDEAQRWLERAVAAAPRTAEYRVHLATAYGQQAARGSKFKGFGLAKKARAELEQAVALDPNSVDARIALVQFYLVAPGIVGGSADKARAQI